MAKVGFSHINYMGAQISLVPHIVVCGYMGGHIHINRESRLRRPQASTGAEKLT